jgi:hypothetical protein
MRIRFDEYPILVIVFSITHTLYVYGESIPSIKIMNYKMEEAYLINFQKTVIGSTYKEACLMLDNCHWGLVPTTSEHEGCYTPNWTNLIIGTGT